MIINVFEKKIGINFSESGIAKIKLWAPYAKNVSVFLKNCGTSINMNSQPQGYWFIETNQLKSGDYYSFEIHKPLDDGQKSVKLFADPASVFQPDGLAEFSKAVDLSHFNWTDVNWKGTDLEAFIIYEIHTGTFSKEGNFKSIEHQLDYLLTLGITAIELMPVSQFPGTRNWGYDGVFPFAVQNSYGGPNDLQNLVNTCHHKGISVILDVVYNHIGPEGNYFGEFGPYFTDKYKTPWGKAINFDDADSDSVRQYFIENALMWFRDFHIDALRMDAVHAIYDFGAVHILAELKTYVDELSAATGRKYNLIAELDLNDNKYINPKQIGGFGLDGQWIDEFHHALRVASGQYRNGYYSDFDGVEHLAKSYRDAYVYDGQYSPHRKKTFGKKADGNRGAQFVVFSQNHDQIGNRMLGERTSNLVSFEMLKLLAGAVFVSPFLPLIFMGEEYGEYNPFQFFISHTHPELVEAVREGRKAEFASFNTIDEPMDPQSETTFLDSKLNWDLINLHKHRSLFNYYQSLISLRKTTPALSNLNRENLSSQAFPDQNCMVLTRWFENQVVLCILNFSSKNETLKVDWDENWINILDSSAIHWNGKNTIKPTISTEGIITLAPESILIFSK